MESDDTMGLQSRTETAARRLVTPNGNGLTEEDFHVGKCTKQKTEVSMICCHNT